MTPTPVEILDSEFVAADQYHQKIDSLVERVEDWSQLPSNPVVSVWMLTFNHEAYIRQALEGVLMQQTSFPYEIIVGDDCSADNTRTILLEFQSRFPDRVRLRLARENLYSKNLKQSVGVFGACRGEYVALCEGDDYWTNPQKLQKQVDFLEANPDFAGCFHDVQIVDELKKTTGLRRFRGSQPWLTLDDVLQGQGAPTASMVYRNVYAGRIPNELLSAGNGDMILLAMHAQRGRIGAIDAEMAAYRVHAGGVWSGSGDATKYRMAIAQYRGFLAYFGAEKKKMLGLRLSRRLLPLAVDAANQNMIPAGRKYLKESIAAAPGETLQRQVRRAILLARLYVPGANRAALELRPLRSMARSA